MPATARDLENLMTNTAISIFVRPPKDKYKHTVYINLPSRGHLGITQFSNFLLLWSSFIREVSFVHVCVDVWKRLKETMKARVHFKY